MERAKESCIPEVVEKAAKALFETVKEEGCRMVLTILPPDILAEDLEVIVSIHGEAMAIREAVLRLNDRIELGANPLASLLGQ